MCGIKAVFGEYTFLDEVKSFQNIKNRGPDQTTIISKKDFFLGFHRLAIVDLSEEGNQPFYSNGVYLICNGEIYNHKLLREHKVLRKSFETVSDSDCAVIIPGYLKYGVSFFDCLDGDFAFVLYDTREETVYFYRDPYGVRPLFYQTAGRLTVCSEIKGFYDLIHPVYPVQPRVLYSMCLRTKTMNLTEFYHFPYLQKSSAKKLLKSPAGSSSILRELLEKSVVSRLMSERPIGALLSGGLDSSLIAAILNSKVPVLKSPAEQLLNTFSIGLSGSVDLHCAKIVAEYLGTVHHEIIITPKEIIKAIDKVIYTLESYDITTIRASIPMYLLSKYISEKTDIKVLFSGEGSDELFGGYLYFNNAPNETEFEEETFRLVENLFTFDNLRADRVTAAHGLELRVPFLDRTFAETVLNIPGNIRMPSANGNIEKKLLRDSFRSESILPPEILNRRKEAFSDGVGKTLRSCITEFTERVVASLPEGYPSKEAYYYKTVFNNFFKGQDHVIVNYRHPLSKNYWMPNWNPDIKDPSATFLPIY